MLQAVSAASRNYPLKRCCRQATGKEPCALYRAGSHNGCSQKTEPLDTLGKVCEPFDAALQPLDLHSPFWARPAPPPSADGAT